MAEDLLTVLTRFHREIVVPDLERVVGTRITPLRDEMLTNFDAVFQRLDRLDGEYHSLSIAVKRVEARMITVDQKIDKVA